MVRLRKVSSHSGVSIVVDHDFTAVERLQRSLSPCEVGIVWGRPAQDEFLAYARRRKARAFRVIADSANYSTDGIARRRSGLYAREIYRVHSFLRKDLPYWSSGLVINGQLYPDPIEFAKVAGWDVVSEFVKSNYVNTRRVKDGSDREIDIYLSSVKNNPPVGSVVLNVGYSLQYEDLITLWVAFRQPDPRPIVICAQVEGQSWLDSPHVAKKMRGEYLQLEEILKSIQVYFGFSEQTVASAFRIWRKSLDFYDAKLVSEGLITPALSAAFADAISDTELQANEDVESAIPSQYIAPLRFNVSEGVLGILASREHPPEDARVRGGAIACRAAAEDLAEYGGFSNPIPHFDRKINRIIAVANAIAERSYDDSLVVQLGTEVSGLEARILSAKDRLLDTAFQEASSFFAVAYGYLAQFQSWTDYKASVARSEIKKDENAFLTSKEVLCDVAHDAEAATPAAQARIGSFVEGLEGGAKTLLQREGAALSAENVASQAAAELISELKRHGGEISGQGLRHLKGSNESALAKWFVQNRSKLDALAAANDLDWLKQLLEKLRS